MLICNFEETIRMSAKNLTNRESSLDIIRIVALFSVISVHFYWHSGFNNEEVAGIEMYILCLMKALFSVCVPLFISLTGYLMCNKKLCKQYYKGIRKTLIIYVLASIACVIYCFFANAPLLNIIEVVFSILNFSAAPYAWYIELYIGLFLLIPFLNLIYNNLRSKKQKQALLLTLIILTILPSLFNIYRPFDLSWWIHPSSSNVYQKIIPSWWINIYPLTYYFSGAYLREFGIKFKTKTLVILFAISVFLFGSFNFYRSYGGKYANEGYNEVYGFEAYILTILLFEILRRIKANNMSIKFRAVLKYLSDLVLGAYLVSYIFDDFFYYNFLNKYVPVMTDRLPYYFLIVPCVFICSLLLSAILNLIVKGFSRLFCKIKAQLHKKNIKV